MIWYEYFMDSNPALKKSINMVMSNKQRCGGAPKARIWRHATAARNSPSPYLSPLAGAQILADMLRKMVGAQRIVKKGSKDESDQGMITFSAGVTDFSPRKSIDTLLKRTNGLLYNAKSFGRNRVVAETAPDDPGSATEATETSEFHGSEVA